MTERNAVVPALVSITATRRSRLSAGTRAPNFILSSAPDQTVSLRDSRGSAVILAFYPADLDSLSSNQLMLYDETLPEFRKLNAELLGISVDSVWCHLAFRQDRKLRFLLLADFEPKGAVARAYRVFRRADGTSERALFVVDGGGIIRWAHVSPSGVIPAVDGILTALEALQRGPAL